MVLQEEQVEAVLAHGADVVCLQEVTPRTAPRWVEALAARGYEVEPSSWPVEPRGLRRLEVLTFARTRSGRLRPAYGERHDRAELALVAELPARGWRDAFRAPHGYERRDRSWMSTAGYGYRLDHLIASPRLEPVACEYVHEWRTRGLSDHSAIWAEIRPAHGGAWTRRSPGRTCPNPSANLKEHLGGSIQTASGSGWALAPVRG